MAKYRVASKGYETGKQITTKSWFGSHADMVVELEELKANKFLHHLHHSEVVCKDDKGYYITEKNRLDNGLADPNRYNAHRPQYD